MAVVAEQRSTSSTSRNSSRCSSSSSSMNLLLLAVVLLATSGGTVFVVQGFSSTSSLSISNRHQSSSTFISNSKRRLNQQQQSAFSAPLSSSPFPSTPQQQNQRRSLTSSSSSSSLYAVGATTAAAGAIAGVLTGGVLGGALHAVSGPDHLAALLPRCCGQPWYKAGRIGALWGMGHGLSATILGVLAFGLKAQVRKAPGVQAVLGKASHVTEIAVGLSLIVIGAMGIREAREWEEESMPANSLSAAASPDAGVAVKDAQKRAVIFNGLLHGFSWDGAPSLAPALAVATWGGNIAFLSAYATGTMAAMALTTTLIGEGTRRAGEVFNRPDIPQKLGFFSSLLAIAIGAVWCGLAFAS
eukprot:CAMPEP_0113447950 /NCGR_PEP_ID=MMETSP0014_2-20120614/4508_1 /TAXON_ID=2857 /ORGANISM="Nitzschia sp." /LENGTH=356 /DNA_ID=CAMNT_0000339133 /DNA_START=563 /DNA_END=1633 /DNA_ORIENTATION=- /assembly_acc=CAM_ASM_000159